MQQIQTNEFRQEIIDAAVILFRRHGFEKTTMEDIARQAHKAKRSLYNHFKNKEEVFGAALKDELTGIHDVLSSLFEDDSQDILERFNAYLLKRAQLLSGAILWQQVLKGDVSERSRERSEAVTEALSAFDNWERSLFIRVWDFRPKPANVQEPPVEATAFADMIQMSLKGLNFTFFIQNKYEQYKDSYTFLINLLIESVKLHSINIFSSK